MHTAEVAVDDMCLVVEWVLLIESEELLRNTDIRIPLSGDLCEQIQSAAEVLVEDGARQVVSMLRIAIQKETAAKLLLHLVDRDVRTGHISVPDQQSRRRQSGKPAANNMRLHPFSP